MLLTLHFLPIPISVEGTYLTIMSRKRRKQNTLVTMVIW
jgi:hypothetical protein